MARNWLRGFVVALMAGACATPQVQERCRFVTHHVPQPPMPPAFAAIDRVLVRRAIGMAQQSRELRGSYSASFRINFAERLLPELCLRLERARSFAAGGSLREAGRSYQSLLVASQVVELALATMSVAEYADAVGLPSPKIDAILEAFAHHVTPVLDAALREDPRALALVLEQHGAAFGEWISFLERWNARTQRDEARMKVARQVWDTVMLSMAAYEAAGSLAEIVASGRPPIPPMAALGAGGAGTVAISAGARLELVEALRKLLASGALDAGVVVGLSNLGANASQMAAPPVPSSAPAPAKVTPEPAGAATYPDPDGLRDLARFREQLGMPKGEGTLARLDVGGRTFYGINAHGQSISLTVNNVSKYHAEADAFEQAARSGVRGGRARMFVDRKLCPACGDKGAVRSLARQLGLERLEVITPEGVKAMLP